MESMTDRAFSSMLYFAIRDCYQIETNRLPIWAKEEIVNWINNLENYGTNWDWGLIIPLLQDELTQGSYLDLRSPEEFLNALADYLDNSKVASQFYRQVEVIVKFIVRSREE